MPESHTQLSFTPPPQKSSRTDCGAGFLRLNDHQAPSVTPCSSEADGEFDCSVLRFTAEAAERRGPGKWGLLETNRSSAACAHEHKHTFIMFAFLHIAIRVLFLQRGDFRVIREVPSWRIRLSHTVGTITTLLLSHNSRSEFSNNKPFYFTLFGGKKFFRGLLWVRDELCQI